MTGTAITTHRTARKLESLRRITDQHSTAGRASSRFGITRAVQPGRSIAENPCKPSAPRGRSVWCVIVSDKLASQLLATSSARVNAERQTPSWLERSTRHAWAERFYQVPSDPGHRSGEV